MIVLVIRPVAVIMSVVMIMGVTVPVIMPVIMPMIIAVVMRVRLADIGAALRGEGSRDVTKACAETFQHVGDHRVLADAQMIGVDLCGLMPVAQMPCEAEQSEAVFRSNLDEGFGAGQYLDHMAVVEQQPVAMIEPFGARQVEQEIEAAITGQEDTATIAVFLVQCDLVESLPGPLGSGKDL